MTTLIIFCGLLVLSFIFGTLYAEGRVQRYIEEIIRQNKLMVAANPKDEAEVQSFISGMRFIQFKLNEWLVYGKGKKNAG